MTAAASRKCDDISLRCAPDATLLASPWRGLVPASSPTNPAAPSQLELGLGVGPVDSIHRRAEWSTCEPASYRVSNHDNGIQWGSKPKTQRTEELPGKMAERVSHRQPVRELAALQVSEPQVAAGAAGALREPRLFVYRGSISNAKNAFPQPEPSRARPPRNWACWEREAYCRRVLPGGGERHLLLQGERLDHWSNSSLGSDFGVSWQLRLARHGLLSVSDLVQVDCNISIQPRPMLRSHGLLEE